MSENDKASSVVGDYSKRYYVHKTGRGLKGGVHLVLIEGVPDPTDPDNPGKDQHTGPVVVEGDTPLAWTLFIQAGFYWTERSFKRFWAFNPRVAENIRSGSTIDSFSRKSKSKSDSNDMLD